MYAIGNNIVRKPKSKKLNKCKKSKSMDCKDNRSGNVGREPLYRADGKLGGLGTVPTGNTNAG